MCDSINIRNAVPADVDFLAETIINAEKSNTEKLSYSTIFEIPEKEVKEILKTILLADIVGQELCLSSFLVAEIDGEQAGACAAWIEGKSGLSSSIIKSNVIYNFFPSENIKKAQEKSNLLKELNLKREAGTLQLESAWVIEKFKGKGICNKIMLKHIANYSKKNPELKKAQIIMVKANDIALNAHKKLGFKLVSEVKSNDKRILDILPSDTMILIETDIEQCKNIFKFTE